MKVRVNEAEEEKVDPERVFVVEGVVGAEGVVAEEADGVKGVLKPDEDRVVGAVRAVVTWV